MPKEMELSSDKLIETWRTKHHGKTQEDFIRNKGFDYTGLEAIQHITTELLEGSEPLDPKYMKVINDNLADLLA